jgi:hypothetical protein
MGSDKSGPFYRSAEYLRFANIWAPTLSKGMAPTLVHPRQAREVDAVVALLTATPGLAQNRLDQIA